MFNKFDIVHSSPYDHLFMATWLDPKFRRTYYKTASTSSDTGVKVSQNSQCDGNSSDLIQNIFDR